MRPGSVIIDLAGETGGNCELTRPGEVAVVHDVTIASPLNLASAMPEHASQLYARNVLALLELLLDDQGELALNFDDAIVAGACIVRDGEIVNDAARALTQAAA
jgi:NAD(P) transhydrogenase subunit alpha